MAIYHFSVKTISRSNGRSAVACSAYRSGEKLIDERQGITQDYTKKSGVNFKKIYAPENTNPELLDRQTLWNKVEKVENRKNSNLAREFEIAFPHEFNKEQREDLLNNLCEKIVQRHGVIVDAVIHAPHTKGGTDDRNYHAHIMFTGRQIDLETGNFAKKRNRDFNKENSSKTVNEWRKNFADITNHHLEKNGFDVRVDHRSHQERGLDLQPTIHEGYEITALRRKGIETDISKQNDAIKNHNALITTNALTITALDSEIFTLQKHIDETVKQKNESIQKEQDQIISRLITNKTKIDNFGYEFNHLGAYEMESPDFNIDARIKLIDSYNIHKALEEHARDLAFIKQHHYDDLLEGKSKQFNKTELLDDETECLWREHLALVIQNKNKIKEIEIKEMAKRKALAEFEKLSKTFMEYNQKCQEAILERDFKLNKLEGRFDNKEYQLEYNNIHNECSEHFNCIGETKYHAGAKYHVGWLIRDIEDKAKELEKLDIHVITRTPKPKNIFQNLFTTIENIFVKKEPSVFDAIDSFKENCNFDLNNYSNKANDKHEAIINREKHLFEQKKYREEQEEYKKQALEREKARELEMIRKYEEDLKNNPNQKQQVQQQVQREPEYYPPKKSNDDDFSPSF